MNALLPLAMSEETRLLTAIIIGVLFGFALERGGFGNARKLVGQFYLHDMTVFKVMFTAIIVAMAGLFTLAEFGLVELAAVWINPTFIWSQVIGGFLLGVGFIISGLCPGTSVVSAASGRIDAWVAFAGIFFGTFVFTLVVEIPIVDKLYHAGSLGTLLLPELLGIPAPVVALLVVGMAAGGFMGAEVVEKLFRARHEDRNVELTPATIPFMKLAVTGAVAIVALVGVGALTREAVEPKPITLAAIDPLTVARRIIARDPNLLLVDVRESPTKPLPGAASAKLDTTALPLLSGAVPHRTTVVLYDETGQMRTVPGTWPRDLDYRFISAGYQGWQQEVLTPHGDAVQNQIAAYFSGATVQSAPVAAPPPTAGGGGAKKKKAGGC